MTQAYQRALTLYPEPTEEWKTSSISNRLDRLGESERNAIAVAVRLRRGLTEDDWPAKVWGFRKVMGLELPDQPDELSPVAKQLHASLLQEEVHEFASASDVIEQADGLIDIIYVALGALLHMGWSPQQINLFMEEVHASNMTKVMDHGRPCINDGRIDPSQPIGKVLKTHNYVRPDLAAALLKPLADTDTASS